MKHKNTGVAQQKMCTDLLTLELTKEELQDIESALNQVMYNSVLFRLTKKRKKRIEELCTKIYVARVVLSNK